MDKEFKKLEMSVTRSNIVIEWTQYVVPAGLQYSPEMVAAKEAEQNTVCKVLAVGDEIKDIVPGDYALMGGVGRLLVLNDVTYGVVKGHMIDMVFKTMPKVGSDEGESQGSIMTDLTQKQLDRFGDKHQYKAQ